MEPTLVAGVVTVIECPDTQPCVGCGRPTHMAICASDDEQHVHVCSPMCFAVVELGAQMVEAVMAGREDPHCQVPVHRRGRKEDLN